MYLFKKKYYICSSNSISLITLQYEEHACCICTHEAASKQAGAHMPSNLSMMLGRVPPRREEPPRRQHAEEPRRGDAAAVERPVVRHEQALGAAAVHLGGAAGRHHPRREGAVLDQLGHPALLLPPVLLVGAVHPRAEVGAHGVEALLDDVHGRGHQRVAHGAEPGELGETTHGVRERGDGVVADVQLPERGEEADAVGELP